MAVTKFFRGLCMKNNLQIFDILERARLAAIDYYKLTGKPLGITGEVGEYLAAKHLGLTLAAARTSGYDATDSQGRLIQIKARAIQNFKRPTGRLGSISLDNTWDVALLVLMDKSFALRAIHQADYCSVKEALEKPGSKARNERRSLAITKFIGIGRQVWPQ